MNQSPKEIHVTGAKRGKMRATKTQLVLDLLLIGWEKVAGDF